MRKYVLGIFSLLLISSAAMAQTIVEITSNITANTTWTRNNIYVLKGANFLYVTNNATLTIEPGTVVKGDPAALIITRGSKLIADGTKEQPIVFTSNRPAGQRNTGDWGGIGLLGRAPINTPGGEQTLEGGLDATLGRYGGNDPADNSGILRYVRIEFAGIAFQPNNEINSLTLGGVGTGTIIEHVQTTFGGDDAFEWFGGTVNGKYLLAAYTVDDMFDTDFGYRGKNQFVLGVSDPNIADISGSNGYESDNDANGTQNGPLTSATFANVTMMGPQRTPATVINTNFRRGGHLRRNTRQSHYNNVFFGWPTGLRLESNGSIDDFIAKDSLKLQGNVFAACKTPVDSVNTKFPQVVATALAEGNTILAALADLNLANPFPATGRPDFRPGTGSPLLTGAATPPADPFWTAANYKGAFGADDWTSCWAEWDPQNADYSKAINYAIAANDFTVSTTGFDAAFTAPDGITSYSWDFGDATTTNDKATTKAATYKYTTAGEYTVTLILTSDRGCTKTITKKVTVAANVINVSSNITTNTTWTRNNIYVLKGSNFLYVTNNATLTIEPGTVVKGDPAALIITRGSKLIADGTKEQPIVFTSNKPAGQRTTGDWGGIGLLGRAPINTPGGEQTLEGGLDATLGRYGGNDPADNSGILRYVRIEFAGIAFQPNNEINSLTLGGVGTGTIIEHVQTTFGGDDAFEWFGGTVNGKYLLAAYTVDDMFDTDFGYRGKNQFVLGVSDPNIADISGSNGFESDNDANGTQNGPLTSATFANVTMMGPQRTPATVINTNFRRGGHLRRNTRQSHYNNVFFGWPTGLRVESNGSIDDLIAKDSLKLQGNVLAACKTPVDSVNTKFPQVVSTLLSEGNLIVPGLSDLNLTNPFPASGRPDFRPAQGSSLLSNASALPNDPFWTLALYKGAFAQEDWTACWAEWDPQNADYSSAVNYGFTADYSFTTSGSKTTFTGPAGNYTYAWDFGVSGTDADKSTMANPEYTYATGGNYEVKLVVTSSRGCTREITKTVSITTSVKDIAELASARLYPNPASSSALLELSMQQPVQAQVRIVAMNGAVLSQRTERLNQGVQTLELSLDQIPTGLYMVQVVTNEGTRSIKLQVQQH